VYRLRNDSAADFLPLDLPALWLVAGNSYTYPLYRVRAKCHIRHVALALTPVAWLAACAGTSPGVSLAPEAPNPLPVPPTSAEAAASSTATPSSDARDKQFEILMEAVNALRQEGARSYARSRELSTENERLRKVVGSLRRDLAKSRGENQALQDQVRALEKKLSEIDAPPPETGRERVDGGGESVEAVPQTSSSTTEQGGEVPARSAPGAEPTPSGGLYHVVVWGENLFRIAKMYGVDYRDLASQNGIDDPEKIEVGQRIFIPGAPSRLPPAAGS